MDHNSPAPLRNIDFPDSSSIPPADSVPVELRELAGWYPLGSDSKPVGSTPLPFLDALAVVHSGDAVGLGLTLAPTDPFTVIGFEHGLWAPGDPAAWAIAWFSHLEGLGHTVISPDGVSVYAFVRGKPPEDAFSGPMVALDQPGGLMTIRRTGGITPAFGPVYGSPVSSLPDASAFLETFTAVCTNKRNARGSKSPAPVAVDYASMSDAELGIIQVGSVVPKRTDWLWRHRLARGELNLLAGNGGDGKTQLILHIASCLSTGADWPDDSGKAPLGRTVIVSAEDDPETTLVPRLIAMGADRANITIVKARVRIEKPGEPALVSPMSLQDRDYWAAVLDRLPDTVLLAIDPLPSYLGRGTDDAKNQELRRVIEPFIDEVTRPRGVAVLANSHLNKSSTSSTPVHRILGSVAYVNLARVVQMVAKDKTDPARKLLVLAKNNLAPGDVLSLAYRIESRIVQGAAGEDIETSAPVFEPVGVAIDLADLMAGSKAALQKPPGPAPTKRADMAAWLVGHLQTKPAQSARLGDLVVEAGELGFLGEPVVAADGYEKYKTTTPLYRAKDFVRNLPAPLAGWEVVSSADDETVAASKDGKARWALRRVVETVAAADEPASMIATIGPGGQHIS